MNCVRNQSSSAVALNRRGSARLLFAAALCLALYLSLVGVDPIDRAEGSVSYRQGGVNIAAEAGRLSKAPRFGHRVLQVGMAGRDVGVLRTMVGSKTILSGRSLLGPAPIFDTSTERAVRRFQRRAGTAPSGVVTRKTADLLKAEMKRAGASWYGPGFYGNRTACGQKLRESTVGVAHKTLPCGSKVLIGYKGRFLLTRVIDRGPFIAGRSWDLTNGARLSLGYQGIDPVRYLVAGNR
jgi:peptidoglycan hydrolase-like protein with peptidoglycan-binding domain